MKFFDRLVRSYLRRKHKILERIYFENYFSKSGIKIGRNFQFEYLLSSVKIELNAVVNFGNQVTFREFCNILVLENGLLNLGNNVFFNRFCSINCLGQINIGEFTIFGEGVKLYDHNHDFSDLTKIIQDIHCKKGLITIGKNCWIGSNVTILNNVTIGDNVIIGANNLIYKDVPANSIIKHKEEQLLEIRR